MAGSNLTVSVSADVTGLRTQLATGKAELAALTAEIKKQSSAFNAASDEVKSQMLPALQKLVAQHAKLSSEVRETTAAITKATPKLEEHARGLAGLHERVKLTGESFEKLTASVSVFSNAASAIGEFALAGLGIERAMESVNKWTESAEEMTKLSVATGLTTAQLYGLQHIALMTATPFDTIQTDLTRLVKSMQEASDTATSQAAHAFQAMGVSIKNADGTLRPMAAVLDEVAAKLATYRDGAGKAALELAVFGRSATELSTFLNELGKDGMAAATTRAQQLGLALSGEASEAAEQYQQHVKSLSEEWQRFSNTVMSAVVPALDAIMKRIAPSLDEAIDQAKAKLAELQADAANPINAGRGVVDVGMIDQAKAELAGLEAQQKRLEEQTEARNKAMFGGEAPKPGSVAAPAISAGGGETLVQQWKNQLLDMQSAEGKFHQLSAAQEAAFWKTKIALTAAGSKERMEVEQEFVAASQRASSAGTRAEAKSVREDYENFVAGIREKIGAAQGNYAAQTALVEQWETRAKALYGVDARQFQEAAQEKNRIAQQQADEQLTIERQNLELQKQLAEIATKGAPDEFKVSLRMVIQPGLLAEQVKAQIQAATAAAEAELQVLADEMANALNQNKMPAYNAAMNQSIIVQAQLAQQIIAINQKAADAVGGAWKRAFDPISAEFNKQMDALISGTETVKQAFDKMVRGVLADLAKSALSGGEQVATNAVTGSSGGLLGGTVLGSLINGGASAATGGATAGGGGGGLAGAAGSLLTKGFGALFGGGGTPSPLASLPAMSYDAASGTTTSVLSTASTAASGGFFSFLKPLMGLLPFMDTGSYQVASDGPAFIHKDEMVIPAEDAEQLRGYMGQGAGPGGRFPAGAFSTPQIAHAGGLSGTSSIGGNVSHTSNVHYAPVITNNGAPAQDFKAMLKAHSADIENIGRKASANGSVRLPGRGR
jgi:hypothetical protein